MLFTTLSWICALQRHRSCSTTRFFWRCLSLCCIFLLHWPSAFLGEGSIAIAIVFVGVCAWQLAESICCPWACVSRLHNMLSAAEAGHHQRAVTRRGLTEPARIAIHCCSAGIQTFRGRVSGVRARRCAFQVSTQQRHLDSVSQSLCCALWGRQARASTRSVSPRPSGGERHFLGLKPDATKPSHSSAPFSFR